MWQPAAAMHLNVHDCISGMKYGTEQNVNAILMHTRSANVSARQRLELLLWNLRLPSHHMEETEAGLQSLFIWEMQPEYDVCYVKCW